ncbi:hypothetical protein H5410_059466 [Solanum commersonii]|uniref:Uncharacterized protein n=1 Tax=Solanum commersonii TaxID=4109 RepID=A0A9J5W316_SOLCO|nr:hypothetical protein H5410_059466 [Solanum commersonii]
MSFAYAIRSIPLHEKHCILRNATGSWVSISIIISCGILFWVLLGYLGFDTNNESMLKLLKKELKALNSQAFTNIEAEANDDREALIQTQNCYKQSSFLAEFFLQQREKATWIKLGDDNFYSVIKHKKLKQSTTQLKIGHGIHNGMAILLLERPICTDKLTSHYPGGREYRMPECLLKWTHPSLSQTDQWHAPTGEQKLNYICFAKTD